MIHRSPALRSIENEYNTRFEPEEAPRYMEFVRRNRVLSVRHRASSRSPHGYNLIRNIGSLMWRQISSLFNNDYTPETTERFSNIADEASSQHIFDYYLRNQDHISSVSRLNAIKNLPCKRFLRSDAEKNGDSDQKCVICYSEYRVNRTLVVDLPSCHHLFHKKCIIRWLKSNETCPLCRTLVELNC